MSEFLLICCFMFFAGNLCSAAVTGRLIAKGGYNSPLPLIKIVSIGEEPRSFWLLVLLYVTICGLLAGVFLEIAGVWDAPWFNA
ncbi:hypothetical protein [Sphingorhabdus sp. SMR4y]|uniref:hypothetical protein n=1 Tax=Sphingorhabdus sp. SMR4y TaxID=2584094 RepID=UPI0011AB7F72|nr:hypothetical protein [Sphingorhabdus sp. SMR4y]